MNPSRRESAKCKSRNNLCEGTGPNLTGDEYVQLYVCVRQGTHAASANQRASRDDIIMRSLI